MLACECRLSPDVAWSAVPARTARPLTATCRRTRSSRLQV